MEIRTVMHNLCFMIKIRGGWKQEVRQKSSEKESKVVDYSMGMRRSGNAGVQA